MLPARNLRTAYSFRRLAAPLAVALAIVVFSLKPLIANAVELPVDPAVPPSSSDTSRELGVRPCSSAWEISGPATW